MAGEPIYGTNSQTASSLIADSNGVAYKGRVAFFDLGNADGDIYAPSPLDELLFSVAHDAGARVHSDSWGFPEYAYTSFDQDADRFLVENPDSLVR